MNSETSPATAIDELEGSLRQAVLEIRKQALPSDSLVRVIDRAIQLCSGPAPIRARSRWLRYCLAIGMAAAILAAAAFWLIAPGDTWAQVVKAVQMKPWIHAVMKTADDKDGRMIESWISFPREVSGTQFADGSAIFDDSKTKVRYEYLVDQGEAKESLIYREPLAPGLINMAKGFDEFFLGAMRGDKTLNPSFISGTDIVSQERRTLVENDRTWTDFDLVLRCDPRDQTIRMVLRVDPKTSLPASMKLVSLTEGRNRTDEMLFDYPDEDAGPRDIYGLGVPRAAKLVDRMPSSKLADVIAGVRASQDRFGSYFAVVIQTVDKDEPWQVPYAHLIWRNGRKWRFEHAFGSREKPPTRPDDNADTVAWWRARLRDFKFAPSLVSDGKTVWQEAKEDGKPMEKLWDLLGEGDGSPTNIARVSMLMPDLVGYHHEPDSGKDVEAKLVPAPPNSPPNSLVAELRYTDPKSRQPSTTRLWFDPAHSYILRRFEWFNFEAVRDDKSPSFAYSIDSIAQSPSGIWYPTCLREKFGESDKLTWFFVDFHAKLPDSLFKPEARTGEIE